MVGNRKDRRLMQGRLSDAERARLLLQVRYVGSGHHKRYPADYGLTATHPRPQKTLCDLHRTVRLGEALRLLHEGIQQGWMSPFPPESFPKYIWSKDTHGVLYEAKTHPNTPGVYHGYPLYTDDPYHDYLHHALNTSR